MGLRRSKLGNKGIASILVAGMLIFFLLAFLVVGIDFAYVYYVRGELQNAADSAALAGAALLDGTNDIDQPLARQEAWKFACKNRAAGGNVFLVTQGTSDCDPTSVQGQLNDGNAPNGDIVVGNWNSTTMVFTPATSAGAGTPVNAVQVMARRWSESGVAGAISNNPVPMLVAGNAVGWTHMSIQRQAIAERESLAMPGMSFCVESCTFSPLPYNFILQKDPKSNPIGNGMAWTEYDQTANIPLGKNSTIADYIWGRVPLPNPICGTCITSNNGVGEVLTQLSDAFKSITYDREDKTFDPLTGNVNSWTVAIPIVDEDCGSSGSSACPPGAQGEQSEPFHVANIANATIISVNTTGSEKGVTISSIQCNTDCSTSLHLGKRVMLVK